MNLKPTLLYLGAVLIGGACAFLITKLQEKPVTSSPVVVGKVTQLSDKERVALCMKSEDCRVMAHASYYEARNQSDEGVVAVMHVIKNRVAHKAWPDTVKGVVYQKNQFSYLWDGSTKKAMKKEQHKRMAVLAHKVLNGMVESPVADSVFYHTRYIKKPLWARNSCIVTIIGSHVFYKGRSKNGECK